MATITLTNVQMRYCNLVKPYEPKVGAPKYTMQFYLEPGSKELKDIEAGLEAAAKDAFGPECKAKLIKAKNGQGSYSLLPPEKNTDELADGRVAVKPSAFADRPLPLFDGDGLPTTDASLFYPGAFVNVQLRFNAYQPPYSEAPPQVKLDLVAVRFSKHGEKIQGRRPSITAEDLEALGVKMDVTGDDLI